MALSKIRNDSLADTAIHGRRNLIINGAMQVWQRSEDNTSSATSWAYRHADRYYTNKGRYRKETATFGGRQWDIMHIDDNSVGYNGGRGIIYKHEEYRDYADTLTLSFYAKASASSTVNVGASNFGGVSLISGQNVTLTTDWKRYDFQLTASSAPTQTGETYIINSLDDGVDYYITGIQLEVGDKATPFEHRSYADELQACKRYFYRAIAGNGSGGVGSNDHYIRIANGSCHSTTQAQGSWQLPVEMRTNPSLSPVGADGDYAIYESLDINACTSAIVRGDAGSNRQVIQWNVNSSGLTDGNGCQLICNNITGDASIDFSAEL